jgi:hypothetical protein
VVDGSLEGFPMSEALASDTRMQCALYFHLSTSTIFPYCRGFSADLLDLFGFASNTRCAVVATMAD